MTHRHRRAECAFCESEQTFRLSSFPHHLHAGLSVLTLGLWLISYAALWYCWRRKAKWRCTVCGHRYRAGEHVDGLPGVPRGRMAIARGS